MRKPEWLLDVAVVASVLYLGMYLVVALFRIGYPFELEWMEGGAVDHVARVLNGEAIYVRPSIDFVPYIYTPLYYYLCAPIAKVIGIGFVPLRLVSLLSSCGCLFVLFWWARRETGNWRYGVIAAGLYAASFRLCGAWFDIARADSLFILFVLSGSYVLRFAQSKGQLIVAAAFLWLSFLTKQTAQFICVPLVLYALIAHRMRSFWFCAVLTGGVGLSVLLLDWLHDGWFTYYIFHIPRLHVWDASQFAGFWVNDILKHFAILVLLSTVALIACWRASDRISSVFYAMFLAGCVAAAWLSRLHTGGYDNVLMPIAMGLSISAIIIVRAIRGRSDRVNFAGHVVIPFALAAQLALFWYNPAAQVPDRAARQAGEVIVESIRRYSGEVYMPYHGFIPTLAGKRSYAHHQAQGDIQRADSAMGTEMALQLQRALIERKFGLIILDAPIRGRSFEANYVLDENMPAEVMSFVPVTGLRTRPRFWYVPRE